MATHHLACDLGAESGRLILGTLDNGRISLDEVHRFPNQPHESAGSLCWNIPRLFIELKIGLRLAASRGLDIQSISTDSWGVDYVLLTPGGEILEPCYHYRDSRSKAGVLNVTSKVEWPEIFHETGIQFMPINTIYQLAAEPPRRLASAKWILGIADAFNFWLSGEVKAEESLASTFQLYNPRARAWSRNLLEPLGFPEEIFPAIVPAGVRLGKLKPDLAAEAGLDPLMDVIATCSHDTGAAVAAVPAEGNRWAYLSSGTWSLLGVELDQPIINDLSRELNFTNEAGYGPTIRLLKNIVGLWIVQECRREWARQGHDWDYATLARLASEAKPFQSLINPADGRFIEPGGMPEKIIAYCRETEQESPQTPGAAMRCVLESLALLYARTLKQLEELLGYKINRLHIVGGGSQNTLLNQLTADAVQIPVFSGPIEATALGNILLQGLTLGHISSLREARQMVQRSFPPICYNPRHDTESARASDRFARLHKPKNENQ